MSKFASNFWGSDFCSTAGFDTLVKRLKEGKRTCTDFEEYLEKRAKIEKDYGDKLMNLARTAAGKDEIGTLRRSWEQLKSETESTGRLHINLSGKIIEELHHQLKEFREQQRDIRRKSEDTVKRAAAHKKNCFNKNNNLRSTYENKCREADKAEETNNRLTSNPQTKPKELTQAARKMEVTKQSASNADLTYQESVRNLEEARHLWEREMEVLCKQFQELEEQRIAFLRHQMWTFCNLCSQTTVDIDESCEKVRKSLEECDVDADIDLFVREKATGSDRPLTIPYVNYYHPTSSDNIVGGGTGLRSVIPPAHHKELPPLPPEPGQNDAAVAGIQDSVYSSISETTDPTRMVEEGYYAAPKSMEKVIALYDYESQGDQELDLEEGDIITVIAKEDDVWWCGQSKGKMGMFPSNYVEAYDEGM